MGPCAVHIVAVEAVLLALAAAEVLYAQDGLGFSGAIDGHPIGESVEMAAYDAWPSGIESVGNAAFLGGVFDGHNVWMIPSNANMVVRVNISSGGLGLLRGRWRVIAGRCYGCRRGERGGAA